MYKKKTIHNYLDNEGNCIFSVRKANIENIQENFCPSKIKEVSNDEWEEEYNIHSIDDVYRMDNLTQQDYHNRVWMWKYMKLFKEKYDNECTI